MFPFSFHGYHSDTVQKDFYIKLCVLVRLWWQVGGVEIGGGDSLASRCLQRLEQTDLLGTGVTDGCKSPNGCWKQNLGPLEEQTALLTAESSLQS